MKNYFLLLKRFYALLLKRIHGFVTPGYSVLSILFCSRHIRYFSQMGKVYGTPQRKCRRKCSGCQNKGRFVLIKIFSASFAVCYSFRRLIIA